MDEYVVGSVADLISGWTSKQKPKKLKLKNKDQNQSIVTKPINENRTDNSPTVKTKNKFTPNELPKKKSKFKLNDQSGRTVTKPINENQANNIPKVKTKNRLTPNELTTKKSKLKLKLNENDQSQLTVKKPINENLTDSIFMVKNNIKLTANELPKKKSKFKLKLNKNAQTQLTVTKHEIENPSNSTLKVKAKKKLTVNELSEGNISESAGPYDTTESHIESVTSKNKKKSKARKRKKSDASSEGEIIKQKKLKSDLFEENHIPSDSENDDNEKLRKDSKENVEVPKKQKYSSNEKTVFVGNIPITYDKKKICKAFSKFGEIQNARIRCVPVGDINVSKKVAAIKKNFNPKRNSLVAFINFKSLDSAKAAVEASGMILDGHHIRVDFADNSKERDNNKAVFVGGLPFDIEDDELWEFFQNCGPIKSVRIIRDSQTSMGKGFGYVNFDSTAAVELALQMNGQELKKRVINVKRCVNWKNKKKFNSFGRQKSKEMANQLLCKRGKKFKEEKKKLKKEKKKFSSDFQGRTANMKLKKKKKLSKAALRQRKMVKILGAP